MTWYKWLGLGAVVGMVIGYFLPHPAPSGPMVTATATTSTTARGGRQMMRIPVPGATVYIEVVQECPEITVTGTGGGSVTTPVNLRESDRQQWRVAVSLGALLPRTTWDARVAARLWGPLGVYGAVEGGITSYVPSRVGGGIILVW